MSNLFSSIFGLWPDASPNVEKDAYNLAMDSLARVHGVETRLAAYETALNKLKLEIEGLRIAAEEASTQPSSRRPRTLKARIVEAYYFADRYRNGQITSADLEVTLLKLGGYAIYIDRAAHAMEAKVTASFDSVKWEL